MELLTPEKVSNDKKARSDEQGRIARKASLITARTLKELNNAKDKATLERNQKEKLALEEISAVLLKRDALLSEVTGLETRKSEALKPVTELQQAAEILMNDAQGRLEAVSTREQSVAEREHAVSEDLERIDEITFGLTKKQASLDQREKRVIASETLGKKSTESLADKWFHYHTTVASANKEISEKERLVKMDQKVIEIDRQKNAERTKELDQREYAINDKFNVLMDAQKYHDRRTTR